MPLARGLCTVLLALSASGLFAAESYQQRLAQVDPGNVDELYELAKWCKENRRLSSYNKHVREILAIDPNHAPTQELRGFIWDGKRWLHRSKLRPEQLKNSTKVNGQSSRRSNAEPHRGQAQVSTI